MHPYYQTIYFQQAPLGAFNNIPINAGVPCRTLYIGNLSDKVTEPLLWDIFGMIGAIESCKIVKDKQTGASAGYGFVEYFDPRVAAVALQQFNGKLVYGMELKVNWAANQAGMQKEDTSSHFHLFVGDLSPEVDDKALFSAFRVFGSISDAKVMMDPNRPDHSRGYGFVAYRKKEDAQRALSEMNGEFLGSKAIRVNWANQKGIASDDGGGAVSNGLDYNTVVNQGGPSNNTVYVGNVTPDVTTAMLQSAFADYGQVEDIKLQADKAFAFVRMATHEQAARAICGCTGRMIGSRPIKCSWGKEKAAATPTAAPLPPFGAPPPPGPGAPYRPY